MININSPANVLIYLNIFLGIINTDLLEPILPKIFKNLDIYEKVGEQQDDLKTGIVLNQSIKMVGFETFNPIKNLGGLYIVIMS